MSERAKFLRAIKKCLSDAYGFFLDAMDTLDEIGRGSVGVGMTPLLGGYAIKDPREYYREALIHLDSADKALEPLRKRLRDGRVDASHFRSEEAITHLNDIVSFDYHLLISMLAQRRGRESVWYRLDELSKKTKLVFDLVSDE
ncbi:MAG: hypothetical protein HXY34_04980 [Candidatus Thorarchaeota archaeon]|nr:hypothetical protein [Candidatus Thorarchaeota archaeon]